MIQEPKSAAVHYDEIPHRCIRDAKSILDVGSSDGSAAKSSHYGRLFDRVNDAGDYLGIDIQEFPHNHYNIIRQDVLDFVPEREYDLVVALHILEHIPIESWRQLLDRLYGCVAGGGYLVVNVPFRQDGAGHTHDCEAMRHLVFEIDRETFEQFLPGGRYLYAGKRWWYFRDEGEFIPYAIVRFFYRVLVRHHYSVLRWRGYSRRMIGIWRKEAER